MLVSIRREVVMVVAVIVAVAVVVMWYGAVCDGCDEVGRSDAKLYLIR